MIVAGVTSSAVLAATPQDILACGSHVYTDVDAVWKEECGADASLDPQTAWHITAFLERSASGNEARTDRVVMRIAGTRGFRKEHRWILRSSMAKVLLQSNRCAGIASTAIVGGLTKINTQRRCGA